MEIEAEVISKCTYLNAPGYQCSNLPEQLALNSVSLFTALQN